MRWGADISGSFAKIDYEEASWNTEKGYEGGNLGHRVDYGILRLYRRRHGFAYAVAYLSPQRRHLAPGVPHFRECGFYFSAASHFSASTFNSVAIAW